MAAAALCLASRADVINVPGDFSTIQAAILASVDGDEIVVAPGTLLSQWGNPGPCDLDGTGSIDVVDRLAMLGAWGLCP